MKTTTLKKIRAHSPCEEGWKKLLKHLGKTKADDEPLPFEVILNSNGLADALWCCRAAPEYDREWRLFSVWCARQVQYLMKDQRSIDVLDVVERFANGLATQDELNAAGDTARAARAAAWAAAGDAEDAAWDAWAAAGDTARAARAAAWAAARDAGDTARAARAAAGDAARDAWAAAGDAARAAQKDCFRWVVNGGLTKFEKGE